jgi:hypothetical protein
MCFFMLGSFRQGSCKDVGERPKDAVPRRDRRKKQAVRTITPRVVLGDQVGVVAHFARRHRAPALQLAPGRRPLAAEHRRPLARHRQCPLRRCRMALVGEVGEAAIGAGIVPGAQRLHCVGVAQRLRRLGCSRDLDEGRGGGVRRRRRRADRQGGDGEQGRAGERGGSPEQQVAGRKLERGGAQGESFHG